jgi:excisionase family DNA binding protein
MSGDAPAMLSIGQVADRCGVSKDAVRRAVRRGELPAAKVFGRIRITEEDLGAYIERGRVGGAEVIRRRQRPTPRADARGSLQALNRKESR